jgi:hypothetical protein
MASSGINEDSGEIRGGRKEEEERGGIVRVQAARKHK